MEKNSSFVLGAHVAIFSGRDFKRVTKATVEKVYKNGNFILKGDRVRRQWRPNANGKSAWRVGRSAWDFENLKLWDRETAKEAAEIKREQDRRERLTRIAKLVDRLRVDTVTVEQLAALEAALGVTSTLVKEAVP